MPTPEEDAIRRRRQAYWLKTARLFDPRKPTLADVAKAAGLAEGSGSVVSLWENDVDREGPKWRQLQRLATYYGLPLSVFTEPAPTDQEQLDVLRALSLAAEELAHEDSALAGEGPDLGAERSRDDEPRRRTA